MLQWKILGSDPRQFRNFCSWPPGEPPGWALDHYKAAPHCSCLHNTVTSSWCRSHLRTELSGFTSSKLPAQGLPPPLRLTCRTVPPGDTEEKLSPARVSLVVSTRQPRGPLLLHHPVLVPRTSGVTEPLLLRLQVQPSWSG